MRKDGEERSHDDFEGVLLRESNQPGGGGISTFRPTFAGPASQRLITR
ncbi:hypothetical protein LPJGGPFB_05097 [Ensifer adhaerens]|nr:hypothetical protein [Ensifer adhaerens]